MRKLHPVLLAWLLVAIIPDGLSQFQTHPLKAEIELQGNSVRITYDISDSIQGDLYNVWIGITDANGNTLIARTFTGDVGDKVTPGTGKEVFWNHEEDGVNLDVGIYIQVFAEPVKQPAVSARAGKEVKPTGMVLQSIVFPGLGLSRVTGQPHWLKGVAGYACIGSAIAFNRMARSTYDDYLVEREITISDELFEKAVQQDQISELCTYAAIGIWVTDIIWNLVAASKMNQPLQGEGKSLLITPYYDPEMQASMLALRFRF